MSGPLSKRYHGKCLVCGLCARALDSEARVVGEGMLRCEACRVSFPVVEFDLGFGIR